MSRLNAANNAQTTLTALMEAGATSFTVANGAVLPTAPFRVTIDSEIIEVGAKSGNVCSSLQHGLEGTTAAAHQSGAVVNCDMTAGMHNELAAISELPHKNLLINWDLRNPVNQRALSSCNPVYGYSMDRWISNDTSITVNSSSVTLQRTGSTNHFFMQRIENASSLLAGKIVTASIEIGGIVYSGSGIFPSVGAGGVSVFENSNVKLGLANNSVTDCGLSIYIPTQGNSITVTRVKLELGSVSTLANDPPANFGEQLALCQRYWRKSYAYAIVPGTSNGAEHCIAINTGKVTSNRISISTPFDVEMRANPTVTLYDIAGNPGKISFCDETDSYANNLYAAYSSVSTRGIYVSASGGGIYSGIGFAYTADAEL